MSVRSTTAAEKSLQHLWKNFIATVAVTTKYMIRSYHTFVFTGWFGSCSMDRIFKPVKGELNDASTLVDPAVSPCGGSRTTIQFNLDAQYAWDGSFPANQDD
jgi:hypothetical protein